MRLLRGYRRRQLCAWVAATLTTVLTLAVVWSTCALAAEAKQMRFASAEAGVEALMAALKANDVKAMLAILGPNARPLIITSDPVADHQERERVVDFVGCGQPGRQGLRVGRVEPLEAEGPQLLGDRVVADRGRAAGGWRPRPAGCRSPPRSTGRR